MSDEFADSIKSRGGLKAGDVLLIPAGTHFSIPVYQGRWQHTFNADIRVEIKSVNYEHYRLWFVEAEPTLHSLPKFTDEPGYIVPDWQLFKIEP